MTKKTKVAKKEYYQKETVYKHSKFPKCCGEEMSLGTVDGDLILICQDCRKAKRPKMTILTEKTKVAKKCDPDNSRVERKVKNVGKGLKMEGHTLEWNGSAFLYDGKVLSSTPETKKIKWRKYEFTKEHWGKIGDQHVCIEQLAGGFKLEIYHFSSLKEAKRIAEIIYSITQKK